MGVTPWGTYLTCEENFNGYFKGPSTPSADQKRYGLTEKGFGFRWHEYDERFDATRHPNEVNRFGWVVEIDPFDPGSVPAKRTALGRFSHEGAAHSLAWGLPVPETQISLIRPDGHYYRGRAVAELVHAGRIGRIRRVEVGLPSGYTDFAGTFGQEQIETPPAGFDYDTWIGPAPWSPYCKARVHMNWRWNMDYKMLGG